MSSPRILLAALAAVLILPAAAQASSVELEADGTLSVRAVAGEANNIHVKPEGAPGVRVRDFGAALTIRGRGCLPSGNEVVCARGVSRVAIELGDQNDVYVGQHGFATVVDAGDGNDHYFHDGKAGLTTTRTDFRGGAGTDAAHYSPATAGVIVTKDGVANDGRTINGTFVVDRDNIRGDVERLVGSPHNDSLSGSAGTTTFEAGQGDDVLSGGSGRDRFKLGAAPDGADIIRGGGGFDTVDYADRRAKVTVTVGHGTRDDGEAGERDDVTGVESVSGGHGDDVISQLPGSTLALQLSGGAGADTLLGAAGNDVLFGDAGIDLLNGGAGADTLFAADGARDTVDCGTGLSDTAQVDASEGAVRGCEVQR